MGAPTKKPITKAKAEKIRNMVAEGATRETIAQWLGWAPSTFYRRLEIDRRLKEAVEVGECEDFQWCAGVMRQNAEKGSYSHMSGYLRIKHGINLADNSNNQGTGSQIVVQLNLGADHAGLGGITLDGHTVPDGEHNSSKVERTNQKAIEINNLGDD